MLTVRLLVSPFIGDPFLLTVMLFDAAKLPLSIIVTSSPTDGEAGSVIVAAAFIPVADVFTNN